MGIIKRLKWKDKTGKTTDYDLGAKASNVEQDATHRFVSDTEKQTWNGKADPEDIPSGSAADYGVANNDTTNRTDMLVTAQVAYQHGREIDQLNSDLGGLSFGKTTEGEWGYKPEGADSVIPFRKNVFQYLRMYYTDIVINSSYTAHQGFMVIPKEVLKSISFTTANMSDTIENDTSNHWNSPCAFVGSAQNCDMLLQNGAAFSYVGAGSANHKVKTVIFRNGTYTFDDFSDFYDYVVFGLASHYYVRSYLTDISIELK